MKLLYIAAIFVGEGLMIAAEAWSAHKAISRAELVEILPAAPPFVLSGVLLIIGYFYGTREMGIWTVSVVSVLSVVLLEPIIVYWMFRELPDRNTVIAFVLGAIGLVLVIKK